MFDLADLSGRMPFLMQVQKGSVSAFEFKQGSSVVSQMCKPLLLDISNEFLKSQWIEILGCDFLTK